MNGCRGRRCAVVEPLHHATLDRRAQRAFDRADIALLFLRDEGVRVAGLCRAAGAADAVDVDVGGHREVKVDDVRDARHVDAAGGDVGRDEHLDAARAESVERGLALLLGHVALEAVGPESFALKLCAEALRLVARAREDEDRSLAGDAEQGDEKGRLEVLRDRKQRVFHRLDRG